MSIALHRASVPVFERYLDRLAHLVDVARSHTQAHHLDPAAMLAARLAADMLSYSKQVEIAANFALRTCFPLAGEQVPPYGEFPDTFDGLRERIARAKALIGSLEPEAFRDAEVRLIEDRAGNAVVRLEGAEFLSLYALPNFFFHFTTAYAILRAAGIPLGKEQFDGFHFYQA